MSCMFCDDRSTHLGINLESYGFSCFRCGQSGSLKKLIASLEVGGWQSVPLVLEEFSSTKDWGKREREEPKKRQPHCDLPAIKTLSKSAKLYLQSRKFPYKLLTEKYKLASFSPLSYYKFRIYIPVYFNHQIVTFTSRAYAQLTPKYLHCPKQKSVLFCKEVLYNIDNAKNGTAVAVEGPTDAWRIGDGAVATFGVIFTEAQVKLLRERFKRVFVMFDAEDQAQKQAQKLADTLACYNLSVSVIKLPSGDPGGLNLTTVKEIRREIFGR